MLIECWVDIDDNNRLCFEPEYKKRYGYVKASIDDKLMQDTDFFDYNEFVLEDDIVVWKPTDKQKTIANAYKNYEYFENNSYQISIDTDSIICDLYEAQESSDAAICSLYEMIIGMNNES